jgi:hypothetical protein
MINTIAGEHTPGSIKCNNVYACYQLDSRQTSPAIFRPLKCVNFFKSKIVGENRVDSRKTHYGIEFLMPVAT